MVETMIANATGAVDTFASPISSVTRLIQALGGIVLLYLIFSIINVIINWKKNKEIKRLGRDVRDIKRLLSKKSKK